MANNSGQLKDAVITGDEVATTALQSHNTKNWKQICQEKEFRGLSPNFHIYETVSDLYIPRIGLPILLLENMWTADSGNI